MNALALCERAAEAALADYGRDGRLVPLFTLLDADGDLQIIVFPIIDENTHGIGGSMLLTATTYGVLFRSAWMTVVSEAWTLTRPIDGWTPGDGPPDLRVGELQERAEAGERLDTSLIVAAYNLAAPDLSHTIRYHVEDGFRRSDLAGIQRDTIMGSAIAAAYDANALAPQPPEGPVPIEIIEMIAESLAGYASGVMLPVPTE